MEISILSETPLQVYSAPEKKVWQRVITYQVEGFVPRTIWLDADKIPDATWLIKNPGKTVPADIQAKGDAVRRVAIQADIDRIKAASPPRKI